MDITPISASKQSDHSARNGDKNLEIEWESLLTKVKSVIFLQARWNRNQVSSLLINNMWGFGIMDGNGVQGSLSNWTQR